MMTSSARRLLIFGAFLVLFGLLHTCEAASARFSFHQLTALRTKSSSGEIISDSKANLLEQHAGLGDVVGPSTSFQLNAYTGGALLLACLCALLANSAGIGGGPFYMPLFVAVLGFNMNAATALSHTVVASGAIASTVYGIWQRSPVDPNKSLVDFSLALTFVPALLVGAGIGVIFNTLVPRWLQVSGLTLLLLFVIRKTGAKARSAWVKETKGRQGGQVEVESEERQGVTSEWGPLPPPPPPAVKHGDGLVGQLKEWGDHVVEEICHVIHYQEVRREWSVGRRRFEDVAAPMGILVVVWAVFLAFKLGMAKSEKCSLWFFLLWGGQTAFCATVTALVVLHQVRKVESDSVDLDVSMQQLLLGADGTKSNTAAVGQLLKAVGIMVVAGATAGLLGIGGALIFNPFLLAMGVHPQVTAATAVIMILFSSSTISISLAFQGLLNESYAVAFAPACAFAALLGVTLVGRIVKQTGRASIIIIILTSLMAVGTVLTVVFEGSSAYNDIRIGENVGFQPFCS